MAEMTSTPVEGRQPMFSHISKKHKWLFQLHNKTRKLIKVFVRETKECFHKFCETNSTSDEYQSEDDEMEYSTKIKKSRKRDANRNSVGSFKHEAYHIVLGKPEVEQPDDLFKKIKFFLIIGRLLGVLPYSGIFKKSFSQLYFYPKSLAAITSISILTALTGNVFMGIYETFQKPKTNAYEIAQSVHATIQFCWGWLIYFNFLLRGKMFLSLFYYWAKTTVFYGMEDRHLKRDTVIITVVILLSAMLENAVLHLEYVPSLDQISGEKYSNTTVGITFLETYYRRSHEHWDMVLGYHEIFAVIAFVQHKCMLYVINYLDIMIAVFSRAIHYKFKMLYRLSYEHLAKPLRKGILSESSKSMSRHAWLQVVLDHKRLCDLLQEFENFFSPLIFGSYAVNIYYICIQLLEGISTDVSATSVVHSIYAPWSFLHIIMRVFVISISAARINSYAHQIRAVLQECPIDCYNAEISRTDKKVTTGPDIGFTGLGCFVVTKPFILKIVSVIFTFEIVLLQGKPNPSVTSC